MSSAEAFKNAFQAVQQSDNFAKQSVPQSGAANAAASGRSHAVSTAERRRQSSNISRQERIAAELERERMTSKSFEDSRALFVHARQRRNTALLSHITNVPIKFTTHFVPDFYLGNNACALYLSVKYHRLHPNYIKNRVCALRSNYRLRVIMVVVDVQDFVKSLQDITRFALANDCTVIVATSNREAARYLETYKLYENKKAEEIAAKKAPPGDFLQQVLNMLTRIPGVNKTDALNLLTAFGSVREIMKAPAHELSLCPGIGPKKATRIREAFSDPLNRLKRT